MLICELRRNYLKTAANDKMPFVVYKKAKYKIKFLIEPIINDIPEIIILKRIHIEQQTTNF